jgi:hypothetical protein
MRSVECLLAVSVLTASANAAQFKLTASDAAEADEFGFSVAVSGDVAVVGARFDDDLGFSSGSAYVFRRVGGQWVEQAKLTASDGAAYDFFGWAVAIDGDTIVVGAPQGGGDAGKVYVFQHTGSVWMEQVKLVADDPQRRVIAFGTAVAIDSDRIVVGAPFSEVSFTPTGSSYVFRRAGAAWSQEAVLAPAVDVLNDRFGASVAIRGDVIGVGAPEYLTGPGSAYVFQNDGVAWGEGTKLASANTSFQAQFGAAIAVDGQTIVVGAPDDDHPNGSGSVLVFERIGEDWTERAKLTASDMASVSGFGSSVAVHGPDMVVRAYGAYLFSKVGEAWLEQAKFVADLPLGFGKSVDVGAVADVVTVVVGAPLDDDAGFSSGSAFVYELGQGFHTLRPCRAADTRGFGGSLGAGEYREFELHGTCGIPATAGAVSVNVAVTAATQAGNLRLYPAGTPLPLASSINYISGQTRSNNAIVTLNGGAMAVFVGQADGTVHFILDVNGYFQ